LADLQVLDDSIAGLEEFVKPILLEGIKRVRKKL